MPQLQWLDDEQLVRARILEDMPEQVRDLFGQVSVLDGGLPLLRFLDANDRKLMAIGDIAYHLGAPNYATVERSLRALVELGLARQVELAGKVFFGITYDLERQRRVRDLCAWEERWHQRLARIECVLDGQVFVHSQKRVRKDTQVPIASELARADRR